MAVNKYRGDAPGVANVWTAVPDNFDVGSTLELIISNKTLRHTVTADANTVAGVVAGWIAARTATQFPEWQEVTFTAYTDENNVLRGVMMTGPADGTPIDITENTIPPAIDVLVRTIQHGTPGQNHIQRVALQAAPTGGTFTLAYRGATTGSIAYNASNGTIQTALEGLSGIGSGQVAVTGATGLWYVEFTGTLAKTLVDLLVGNGTSLTGACSVRVETNTQGKAGTNFVQRIGAASSGVSSWLGSVNVTINDIDAGIISLTSSSPVSHLQTELDSIVGAPQALASKLTDDNGVPYFLVEWMGIYEETETAEVAYNSGSLAVETEVSADPTNINEVQTLYLLGNPTGGTFTATYSGQTTSGVAYNASAGTFQTALEALSNIAPGEVSVTGGSGAPFVVEFTGTLGGLNVPQMTGSGASLTGASFSIITYQVPVAIQNEVQEISFSSEPSSGNWTATYSGQTTGNIAYNASASTIQTALIALSNIGPGEVVVTGDALGPFQVEFSSGLGGTNVVEMTGTNVSLAGAGAETITLTETQAESGPHHWDNALNWSLGAVPVDGDTVVLDGDTPIKYGLAQGGVDPALIVALSTFTGGLGLPDWNENGYFEYRTKDLAIGTAATVLPEIIGEGEGPGCPLYRRNLGTTYPNIRILKTARTTDVPAVLLRGGSTGTGNRVELLRGSLGFCFGEGETGTIKNLVVGFVDNKDGDATYFLGSGATVTQITQNGGFGVGLCTGHKMKLVDGFFAQERSGWTIAEWKQQGGEATLIGSGTVSGTANLSGDATLELLNSDQNISFANAINIYGDSAELLDDNFRAIITGQTYMERKYIQTTRFGGMPKDQTIRNTAN